MSSVIRLSHAQEPVSSENLIFLALPQNLIVRGLVRFGARSSSARAKITMQYRYITRWTLILCIKAEHLLWSQKEHVKDVTEIVFNFAGISPCTCTDRKLLLPMVSNSYELFRLGIELCVTKSWRVLRGWNFRLRKKKKKKLKSLFPAGLEPATFRV